MLFENLGFMKNMALLSMQQKKNNKTDIKAYASKPEKYEWQ